MAYIKVDLKQLREISNRLEQHVDAIDEEMKRIDQTVKNVKAGWKGEDSENFISQWEKYMAEEQGYRKSKNAMTSYSEYLKTSVILYRKAISEAQASSKNIPL